MSGLRSRIPRPASAPSRPPLQQQDENVAPPAVGAKRGVKAVSPAAKSGPPRKRGAAAVTTAAAASARIAAAAAPTSAGAGPDDADWEAVAEEMGWASPADCLGHKLTFPKRAADKAKVESLVAHVKRLRAAGWHLAAARDRAALDAEQASTALAAAEAGRSEDKRTADEALASVQAELGGLKAAAAAQEAELGAARLRAQAVEGELGGAREALRTAQDAAARAEAECSRLGTAAEDARAAAKAAGEARDAAQAYNSELQQYNSRMQGELKAATDALARAQADKAAATEECAALRGRVAALEGQIAAMQAASSSTEAARSGALEDASRLRGELAAAASERAGLLAEAARLRSELESAKREVERYREATGREVGELEAAKTAAASAAGQNAMQAQINSNLAEQVMFLRSGKEVAELQLEKSQEQVKALSARVEQLENELAEAQEEVRAGEALRRRLHNTIQELKGNIRVFCRVRPPAASEAAEVASGRPALSLPAEGSLEVAAPAPGCKEPQIQNFKFDQVFGPTAGQGQVFEEISQLVQSSLDGYKVCIFAYGQTGSGKTHTMMGNTEDQGMIPRAMEQVFATANALGAQGWKFEMKAAMVEVYNEEYRDLLGKGPPAGKKHQVSHDERSGATSVSYLEYLDVGSSEAVADLMARAMRQRSVAATAMNEQSSRSHMVFMLNIEGANAGTGQRVRGALNLIDLAGSERLGRSGAAGERLKETQAINKSLAALGDVIAALGSKSEHVPYRNSKLTYLLQGSLGGASSKTLMFVNISPAADSVGESLCSLRFAIKVNATEIGTAKRQVSNKP